MTQFLDTDEEMGAYMEAEEFARARIPMKNMSVSVEHDRISGLEKLYTKLPSGALVLVNERAATANQTLMTNEAKSLKDIENSGPSEPQSSETTIDANGRWPIETIRGGSDGPVLDDYLAAGYTEEEFQKYETWQRNRILEMPGMQVPRNLSQEEIEQYAQEVNAQLMEPMDENFRSQGREAARLLLTENFGMDANEAEMMADTLFGTGLGRTPIGGAVDITALGGLMALSEGRRAFEMGMRTGDPLVTGLGILEGLLGAIELLPYASVATGQVGAGVRTMEPRLRSAIERIRGMQSESGAQSLSSSPVAAGGAAALLQASGLSADDVIEEGNIDLSARTALRNPDGTVSTIESISIGTDQGEVLIPTISPEGNRLSEEEAIELYERTGQHLGIFASPDAASAFARRLSDSLGEPQ